MENIIKTTLLGLFFGTFGTTLGGMIGISFNKTSNKFLSFILSFASGLMLSIVCFELIPESMAITNISHTILGVIMGVITMIICDTMINKKIKNSKIGNGNKVNLQNQLLKTGMIVSVGLAIHNLPEGLAIGSGFESSLKLGYSIAMVICLHDIPEGISMSVPMKSGGMRKTKVIFYVVMSGITTGIGALIGSIVGSISQTIIAICLAFAGGAMLYIISGELIPESNKLYQGRLPVLGNIAGFLIGIFAIKL